MVLHDQLDIIIVSALARGPLHVAPHLPRPSRHQSTRRARLECVDCPQRAAGRTRGSKQDGESLPSRPS
eukprot:3537975-Pyramimonas_sp.AAC.1